MIVHVSDVDVDWLSREGLSSRTTVLIFFQNIKNMCNKLFR